LEPQKVCIFFANGNSKDKQRCVHTVSCSTTYESLPGGQRPGQEASLTLPCSNLRSFGSILVTLLGLVDVPIVI